MKNETKTPEGTDRISAIIENRYEYARESAESALTDLIRDAESALRDIRENDGYVRTFAMGASHPTFSGEKATAALAALATARYAAGVVRETVALDAETDESELSETETYLRNEPVFYVRLDRSYGPMTRESFIEATSVEDATATFKTLPVKVREIRRATVADAPLFDALEESA